MKIEIGAGTKGRPGYVHVDTVPHDGIDVVDDGRYLQAFDTGVADALRASGLVDVYVRAEWDCREANGRLNCPALVAEGFRPASER